MSPLQPSVLGSQAGLVVYNFIKIEHFGSFNQHQESVDAMCSVCSVHYYVIVMWLYLISFTYHLLTGS